MKITKSVRWRFMWNQLGYIVLWLFGINKRVRYTLCKVSLHAHWTGDRKGNPGLWGMSETDRGYREWRNMGRWKTPKIILLVLFKCHTPGKETFHMFLCSHFQMQNAPGFSCLMGGRGKLCPGKTLWMSHFPLGKMQAVSSFAQCTVPASPLSSF